MFSEFCARFWISHFDNKLRERHYLTFPILRACVFSFISKYINAYFLLAASAYFLLAGVNKFKYRLLCIDIFLSCLGICISFLDDIYILLLFCTAGFIQFVIFHKLCYGFYPIHLKDASKFIESAVRLWYGFHFVIVSDNIKLENEKSLDEIITHNHKLYYCSNGYDESAIENIYILLKTKIEEII